MRPQFIGFLLWRTGQRLPVLRLIAILGVLGSILQAALAPRAGAPQSATSSPPPSANLAVHGVTISCQTYGPEWGTDAFGSELDRLAALGVNWVAIHPYARIAADGTVSFRYDSSAPPVWMTRPIEEAHQRGMRILVKPHLAYWGSPFAWRGDITFGDDAAWARFFKTYEEWIVTVARITRGADAFVVGTELDKTLEYEERWRAIVAAVRGATPARLTYAANWSDFERVGFWDTLDAVGVQAYFPLVAAEGIPDEDVLRAGWTESLRKLRAVHERTGKPVVFTELGYDRSPFAALRPWESGRGQGGDPALATELQRRCLAAALDVLRTESDWLRGAFLWKWFVGPARRADFQLDRPELRSLIQDAWLR